MGGIRNKRSLLASLSLAGCYTKKGDGGYQSGSLSKRIKPN